MSRIRFAVAQFLRSPETAYFAAELERCRAERRDGSVLRPAA